MAVVLLVVALICFVLAAFTVTFAHVLLVPLGLALFAGYFLVKEKPL